MPRHESVSQIKYNHMNCELIESDADLIVESRLGLMITAFYIYYVFEG